MSSGDLIATLLYGPMWTFLCVLGRTGPLLAMMPPIQGSAIPNRVKVLLARLRNAVLCLRLTLAEITPESVEQVYYRSIQMQQQHQQQLPIADMLLPENIITLTAAGRRS